jgi:serine protease Do
MHSPFFSRLTPAALRLVLALAFLTALATLAPTRADTLDAAMDKVFVVSSAEADARFLGSAFLWAEGKVAVTNAHVAGEASAVRLTDRAGKTVTATVIARDLRRDVAVLAVAPGVRGLEPTAPPPLGGAVWALGAPLGLDFTLTAGIVSARPRQVEPAVPLRLIQHDAAVNPGSSGGPLVDAQGRVVGMNSRIADGSRLYAGMSFAIAAPDLARIVDGLIAGTLPPVPALGLHLRPVSAGVAEALAIRPGGALVDRVAPSSPAARAGLAAGDVIVAAADMPLTTPGDLAFAVEAVQAQGRLPLILRRGAAEVAAMLHLPDAPDPPPPAPPAAPQTFADLGLTVTDRTMVTAVAEDSPARYAGFAPGDRILRVNGEAPGIPTAITRPTLFLVAREGATTLHLILDPAARDDRFRPVGGANVLDPAVTLF